MIILVAGAVLTAYFELSSAFADASMHGRIMAAALVMVPALLLWSLWKLVTSRRKPEPPAKTPASSFQIGDRR